MESSFCCSDFSKRLSKFPFFSNDDNDTKRCVIFCHILTTENTFSMLTLIELSKLCASSRVSRAALCMDRFRLFEQQQRINDEISMHCPKTVSCIQEMTMMFCVCLGPRKKKKVVMRCSVQPLTYIFRIRQIKILCKLKCNFHFRLTLFYRCYFVVVFRQLFFSIRYADCRFPLSAAFSMISRTMNNGIEIQSISVHSFYAREHRPNLLVVALFNSISLYLDLHTGRLRMDNTVRFHRQ